MYFECYKTIPFNNIELNFTVIEPTSMNENSDQISHRSNSVVLVRQQSRTEETEEKAEKRTEATKTEKRAESARTEKRTEATQTEKRTESTTDSRSRSTDICPPSYRRPSSHMSSSTRISSVVVTPGPAFPVSHFYPLKVVGLST